MGYEALKGTPTNRLPALNPFFANQPWCISSTKRTGFEEQWESVDWGFISAKLTMVPSSATNAAVRGSRVFFIQKHWVLGCSNTNNMPSCAGISLRNIRPMLRCSGVWATWVSIWYMPNCNLMRGNCVCGWSCAPETTHQNKKKAVDKRRLMGSL